MLQVHRVQAVARAIQRPVFVASRAFTPIDGFMIAYDGGKSAMKAVDYVARSRLFAGLKCRLVTVGGDEQTRKRISEATAFYRPKATMLVRPQRPDNR